MRNVGIQIVACAVPLLAAGCEGFDTSQIPGFSELAALSETPESTELSVREDRDGDGLSNIEEDALGTHHADPDTDGDGNDDFLEISLGTDPNTPNTDETVDGVPRAFDGLILPGESRVFFRGVDATTTAYVRLMGLVRQETRIQIDWQEIVEDEVVTSVTTVETMQPRQFWYWGHDLGAQAIVVEPADMTVTQLEVSVLPGGDSVFYQFISSAGLENGPRGFVDFPSEIAEADLDFTLLMAHGLGDEPATWDSFAFIAERISPDIRILRTQVEPSGSVAERAGELARYMLREDAGSLYGIGHSMGGLDLRYILTKGSEEHPAFIDAANQILGVYTIATPHYGAFLASLVEVVPEVATLVESAAPAVTDLEPGSDVLDYLNGAFDGDVSLGARVVPIIALVFHAGSVVFTHSDGVVELTSQAFGDHVVSDIPSSHGAGLGAGKHIPAIPTRADPEVDSFEVLGFILSDIVARRAATEPPSSIGPGIGGDQEGSANQDETGDDSVDGSPEAPEAPAD